MIDFSTELKGIRGEAIPRKGSMAALDAALTKASVMIGPDAMRIVGECIREATGGGMTLADICADALVLPIPGEGVLAPGVAARRRELGMRIIKGGEQTITPDERDMMKDCISRFYEGAIIPDQARELLEGSKP